MSNIIYKWDYPNIVEIYNITKLNMNSDALNIFKYVQQDTIRISKFVSMLQANKIQIEGLYTLNPTAFLFVKDLEIEFYKDYKTFKNFVCMYDGILYDYNTTIDMLYFYNDNLKDLKNYKDKEFFMCDFQSMFFNTIGIVDIDTNHAYID